MTRKKPGGTWRTLVFRAQVAEESAEEMEKPEPEVGPLCWEAGDTNTGEDGVRGRGSLFRRGNCEIQSGYTDFEPRDRDVRICRSAQRSLRERGIGCNPGGPEGRGGGKLDSLGNCTRRPLGRQWLGSHRLTEASFRHFPFLKVSNLKS